MLLRLGASLIVEVKLSDQERSLKLLPNAGSVIGEVCVLVERLRGRVQGKRV